MINKRLINTGEQAAPFDALQNFEVVTYTGNGGTQKITGYIRKGAAFNGSSSRITIDSFSPTTNMAVSCWINARSFDTADNGNIVIEFSNGYNIAFSGSLSTDANNCKIWAQYSNGNGSQTTSNTVLTTGTWYHIVANFRSGASDLYIDGTSQSGSGAGTYLTADQNTIGSRRDSATEFDGVIDQIRIFNKNLSSSEVTTLYGETYASSTKSTKDIFNDGSAVALYELDEDANDTGRGTIDSGQSAVFNGSSSNIDIGGNIVNGLTELSVSLWVFWDGTNSVNDNYFIALGKSNSGKIFSADITNNSGIIGFYDGATVFNSNSAVPQNTWTHIVITANATVAKIYLNGNLDSTHTISSLNFDSSGNVGFIGSWISGTDYEFDGKIDQVRVYSSALSASDVEALVSETSVPTANLLAHYKLDGDVTDETGTYNGTATSITYSDPAEFPVYNGTPTAVNFLGMAFQPDLVWIKDRDNSPFHVLQDSVRGFDTDGLSGANSYIPLNSNYIGGESDMTATWHASFGYVTSLDSNGFTVVYGPNSASDNFNGSGVNYVAWCWKAGGAAVSNTNGSITSTVSANPDAGFSIVKWAGDNSTATIGHGLSSAPEIVIRKRVDDVSNWAFDTTAIDGSFDYLFLDTTASKADHSSLSAPTSTVFSTGGANFNGLSMIAYCFHSVDGYQKVGSYSGGTSGYEVTLDFTPRFVMIKEITFGGTGWVIVDSQRGSNELYPHGNSAEDTTTTNIVLGTDKFTLNTTGTWYNASGRTYIYLAIA